MINVLSYIGMNVHSEVCLWTLLGLIRTIFDATLFRVNANLKQVWQMSMPEELSMSVQRVLRTMISSVMLVQCFTVYVYLASYIVLLYPVFLKERPALVLPWLLLAAIRQLLCELTSLALGLGTCVLLGPARPPCIKFVIIKLISIMPAVYMWMLLYSYSEGQSDRVATTISKIGISSRMMHSTDTSAIDILKIEPESEAFRPKSNISHMSETVSNEDWFGSEVVLPRGSDRILDQFVVMLLRIGAYLDKKGLQAFSSHHIFKSTSSHHTLPKSDNVNYPSISPDDTETPQLVGSSKENTALYLREYPQIFMKRSVDVPRNDSIDGTTNLQARHESEDKSIATKTRKKTSNHEVEEVVFSRKYKPVGKSHQRTLSQSVQSTSKTKNIESDFKELKLILKDTDTINDLTSGIQTKECQNKSIQSYEMPIDEGKERCLHSKNKNKYDNMQYETKPSTSSSMVNTHEKKTSTTSEERPVINVLEEKPSKTSENNIRPVINKLKEKISKTSELHPVIIILEEKNSITSVELPLNMILEEKTSTTSVKLPVINILEEKPSTTNEEHSVINILGEKTCTTSVELPVIQYTCNCNILEEKNSTTNEERSVINILGEKTSTTRVELPVINTIEEETNTTNEERSVIHILEEETRTTREAHNGGKT